MTDFNNEENIKKLVKSAHKPVAPSPEFKEQLLERLIAEEAALTERHPMWTRPKVWVPVAAAVVSVVIGYGVWLSLTLPLP